MSNVLDTSMEAARLLATVEEAVAAVRDGITDVNGASMDCFLDYEDSNGTCASSQSPVCMTCRLLNGAGEE